MPQLKKIFTSGKMNKDADERLLPQGEYRHAENITVINSESSENIGTAKNVLSNKILTEFTFTGTVYNITPKPLVYEAKNRIYWLLKDDIGCYMLEYNINTQTLTSVLTDTRPPGTRVLDLDENFLITGIDILKTEEENEELILWTDNNIEPCCINIERAKSWLPNQFSKEDIYLIKAPPRKAPVVTPTTINEPANNIEEKFLTFFYRYKFLDGEYSALSSATNYKFTPKKFELDFFTLENNGMVNSFNAITIEFNTGARQVSDIEIVFKYSNSNTLYRIEKFNKEILGWNDNETKDFVFSNNKTYSSLPEKELYRTFDNVPRKAKAQTLLDNFLIFGNYLENYNLIDSNGDKVKIDYTVDFTSTELDVNEPFTVEFPFFPMLISNPTNIQLTDNGRFILSLNLLQKDDVSVDFSDTWEGTFFFFLQKNYTSLEEMYNSDEFQEFLDSVNYNFVSNWQYTIPANQQIISEPRLNFNFNSPNIGIQPIPAILENTIDLTTHIVNFKFSDIEDTNTAEFSISQGSSSCKSNRDYEIGIIYLDEFGRKTTTLTSLINTIYIPQSFSTKQNKLKITIPPTQKPPSFADRYKIVVKTLPLIYENIYINEFYNDEDNFYVWCKLEGDTKDKVQKNDTLIVKKAPEPKSETIKIKVLDIREQEKNFLTILDQNGVQINIEAGLYMKIRPNGFSMDIADYKIYQNSFGDKRSSGFPVWYLDLFTSIDGTTITELPIPQGSSIKITINSSRLYNSGYSNAFYEKEYYASEDYETLEDWFNENFIDKNHYLYTTPSNELKNYRPNLSLVRGNIVPNPSNQYANPIFQIADPLDPLDPPSKLYLRIKGLYSGGSGRDAQVRASIVIRTTTGFYCFETEEKQTDTQIFYETEETFDIEDGFHKGNFSDQTNLIPAEIELDFFNCYTQGNGVESYKIKDGFNKNALNIDTFSSAKSDEEYRENRRFADLTHSSEPYNESSNVNGLNNFNLSTANFKELDKQYSSIQLIHKRLGDILVIQEEKAGQVLFGKEAIYTASGEPIITKTSNVLGQYTPYQGNNGIGVNPESFAQNNYRYYWFNTYFGVPIRLSIDGTTEINYGMQTHFRNLSINHRNTVKIGAFDTFNNLYTLFVNGLKTITFSDDNNGWTSFWNYSPDGMCSADNRFFSIKNGQLYLHNNQDDLVPNTFYGEQTPSKLFFYFNEDPTNDKIFKTIEIEGTHAWDVILKTNLTQGDIYYNEFNKKESRFYAYIRKNNVGQIFFGISAQGIGNITNIIGNNIYFNYIPETVNIDDKLFQNPNLEIGTITDIDFQNNIITIGSFTNTPTINQFCFTAKNERIEGADIRGYYMEVHLTNNDNQLIELFAINTNAVKSYV